MKALTEVLRCVLLFIWTAEITVRIWLLVLLLWWIH